MKTLIVEDEFISRKLLQSFLAPYGETDIAINGKEALDAFKLALNDNSPYDLMCLDIMMPELDGQSVLKEVRRIEEEREILGLDGIKVIMTTALSDPQNIKLAFKEQCEAYLIKPISKEKIVSLIKKLELI